MQLSKLNFTLPDSLIAHAPSEPRDTAKLLILNRHTKEITHKHFYDIVDLLTPNDVLVLNNTKVFPARLMGKKETGGAIEILLLEQKSQNTWTAMHRGKLTVGNEINFTDMTARIIEKDDLIVSLEFSKSGEALRDAIWKEGQIPLPPYIYSKDSEEILREKYQTVYAKLTGSVAAPTAGLHFTEELLEKIEKKGVQIEYVTLHVGMGTFLPIKDTDITKHKMHSEYYEIKSETAIRLNEAKGQKKRIIAVGTTTTRVLESVANSSHRLDINKLIGTTDIFMYPPYQFQFIDGLITNFHLPHSTLLALIAAFVSKPNTEETFTDFEHSTIGHAYTEAINKHYHFYSFGDACFIF